jgi:pyridoxal phosphate enzyme (YggS family)
MYNIEEVSARYRKSGESVRLMAVTKTVPPERVNIAIDAGINLLGENRVQEYLSKADFYKPAEVHFIGSLQTNKVRQIVGKVSTIQSVNSERLMREISARSVQANVATDVLIEVNIGDEESKSGAGAKAVRELVGTLRELPNISYRGLMAIPPPSADESVYAKLRDLYEGLKSDFGGDTLSVGMSDDYETAIKYGSTLVRIGSGIFGQRF